VGNTYFIQQSDDLLSWQYMPSIIEGEDKVAEWQFSNDQNTAFVRLKYTDMPTSDPRNDDFDSDDINNWSELLQQSDPLASDDQDSNGIPDDWELFWNDQFGVFPSTVAATLTHRDSTTQQLYLNNPVSPDANFTITLSNNLAGTQIVYDYEDNLTGGAIYNWTDISTSGTLLTDISETDNAAQEVVLNNFTFPFYGTSNNQVYVASNGLLTFGTPSAESSNDAIPYEYEPNNFIALLWDDLDTNDAIADDGGEVYFQEFADRIIVQYERVMRDSDSDPSTQSNTFQVVLHASGLIDVHYKEIGGYTGSATVGIEDSSGTNGIEVLYNGYRTIHPTFELSNGLALSYTPQSAKFVQVSPLAGTTTTGSSSTLEVNFNSYDLAPGSYTANIDIAHTGTGTTPWIITAVLEVINTPATMNLYQPFDGQVYWSDETVTFSADVYDSDFGIERVDYLVNGAVEDQDISGSYYSGSWSPTVGQHEVIARAVDLYGTTTDSVVVTITVLADSDFDRMEDEWEQQHFGSLNQEASADFDGDGIPNIFEYNHGTDPADALSKLTFAETQTSDYTYFLVDETLATETDVAKTSLSAAISRANDFDVIEVRPGTYHEALGRLYDRLYVFSTAGARNTTIDTSGLDDRALTLRSESVFSGLSFRGADPEYTYFDGGAVYLSIYGDQNKPRFIGCRFIDNIVGDRGGAIYIGSGDPLFIACTIAGNLGGSGSAIYNSSSSNDITLVNTLLWNPGTSPEIDGAISSIVWDHSLTRGVTTGNVLIDGVDQGTDDPGLAYDYSLAAGSIARDRGSLGAYSDYANLPDCDGEAVLATRDIGTDGFIDSDGHGLPDWIELQAGIDLNATDDNDLDLLNNLEDYENMGNPFLDDTDDDGLLDGDELYADGTHGDTDGYSTGINNTDTDNDGMGDGWEVAYGFNPTSANAPSTDSDGDGLTDEQEFSSNGNPFSADTDNNGMSDALEYRYEMNLSTHVDSDTDGMPDDYETAFALSPTDPSDASLDKDNDALSNLEEYQFGTQANYFDSDGDLLGDGWEVNQGLNPLQANLLDDDSDQDGLDTYDEYLNGTNPSLGDSDSDGTPDGTEVAQGSNPSDASDNGQAPPPDNLQEVNFTVGDPSGNHSERWEMTITGLEPDTRVIKLSNRDFGTMTADTPYQLWKDSDYEITIVHLGTKQTETGPDYDWQAQVEGLPTTSVLSGGATHTDASRFSVIHNHWILDNEDGLLGIVNQSFNNSNYASDKSAKLLKVDLDIVHPATGELDESKEDVNDGGYVSIKREVDGDNVAPVTQLKLHANRSLPSTAKFRLKFANGGRYKIYSDDTRQTLVESEVTEFDADTPTTLYFQGLEKSLSRGGEEITMQIGVDGNWYDGDSVKCTVVQSEFEIVNRVFIPYNWVDIPWHPLHADDVAEGDDRDFDPTLAGTYQVEQRVVVNAYQDLASNRIRNQSKAPGETKHFDGDDVVNFDENAKHSGLAAVQPSYIPKGASLKKSGFADISAVTTTLINNLTNETQTFIEFEGSASEPIIIGAVPIDWLFNVGIEIDDPLNPTAAFSGMHDGFPAYEVSINAEHPIFPVTEVLKWAPPSDRGVEFLVGGATQSAGSGIRVNIEQ
jgi:hypothetical protein